MPTPDLDDVVRVGDPAPIDDVLAHARYVLNRAVRGRFEIHYDTRTVVLDDLNGDTAMRLTALLAEFDAEDPSSTRWSDPCDPRIADASFGWVSICPDAARGARWRPERHSLGRGDRRRLLGAAARLVESVTDFSNPSELEPDVLRDVIVVYRDMLRWEDLAPARPADDHGESEPEENRDADVEDENLDVEEASPSATTESDGDDGAAE